MKYKKRSLAEFTVWNHVFFVYELIRCVYYEHYIFLLFGSMATGLSFIRHVYREQILDKMEQYSVLIGQVYALIWNLYYLSLLNSYHLYLIKITMMLLYNVARNFQYERVHPWFHILGALDVHINVNVRNRYFNITSLTTYF